MIYFFNTYLFHLVFFPPFLFLEGILFPAVLASGKLADSPDWVESMG